MVSLECQFSSLFFKAPSFSLRGSGGLEVSEKAQNSILNMPKALTACIPTGLHVCPTVTHIGNLTLNNYSGTWRRQLCEEFPLLCSTQVSQQCTLSSLQKNILGLIANFSFF